MYPSLSLNSSIWILAKATKKVLKKFFLGETKETHERK